MAQDRRRHERRVFDPGTVVDLVPLLESPQDGDGIFHRRLITTMG